MGDEGKYTSRLSRGKDRTGRDEVIKLLAETIGFHITILLKDWLDVEFHSEVIDLLDTPIKKEDFIL